MAIHGNASWQNRLAKKISDLIKEKNLLQKLEKQSNEYFDISLYLLDKAIDEMILKLKKYIENLEKKLIESAPNKETKEKEILALEEICILTKRLL